MIGGRVFVRGIACHHTVFYLARLGDRIPTAPRIPPDQYPRSGKMRGVLSLVGELHKLLSCLVTKLFSMLSCLLVE